MSRILVQKTDKKTKTKRGFRRPVTCKISESLSSDRDRDRHGRSATLELRRGYATSCPPRQVNDSLDLRSRVQETLERARMGHGALDLSA